MSGVKHVALLRGINLGRSRRVAMADLRALVREIGYPDAVTYLQSGNVVYTAAKGGKPDAAAAKLEGEIEKRFGMPVSVVIRTGAELATVVEKNPMPEHAADPTKFAVVFLAEKPARGRFAGVDPDAVAPDRFRVVGRDIYLALPNGFAGSNLGNGFWQALGDLGTTRNWRTVTKLRDLASG